MPGGDGVNATLPDRLNQILPRITSQAFLSGEGIGNEIACYIFDYPPEYELEIRDHFEMMQSRLASHHSEVSVLHLNLLDVSMAYLERRGLLEKSLKMQTVKGDSALLKALSGAMAAEKIRDFIDEEHKPSEYGLVLLSGVGSVWPILRAHSLLNCLHTIMGNSPLVMFYPGTFDGTTLKLFSQIATAASKPGSKPYYRAFALVPEGNQS
jgi:hypothetical protein